MNYQLEICVDSFDSTRTALKAGADRVELCSALELGGLTPSYGLIERAAHLKNKDIYVMIRPRAGDFNYTAEEFETMKTDIKWIKKMPVQGIVVGLVNADGYLDLERLAELSHLAKPLKCVLHRAFDVAKSPEKDIPAIVDLGFIRILTSGQKETAAEGSDYIAKIQKQYGNLIEIMPGSGVNDQNALDILKRTNCSSIHMSGKLKKEVIEYANEELISKVKKILAQERG